MISACVINLNNLAHNYRAVRATLKPGVKLMGVVKADAYGHGAVMVSKTLEREGIDSLSVAIPEEAVILRENGIGVPILVFGRTAEQDIPALVRYRLDATVFDLDSARSINEASGRAKHRTGVYVKFDTGMGRLGIMPDERSVDMIRRISEMPNILLKGVYSHFSSSEKDREYTVAQFQKFQEIVSRLKTQGIDISENHICNSAASMLYPEMHLDMVRTGLILYGLYPDTNLAVNSGVALKPVMSIRTSVTFAKRIESPSYISYGNTYAAKPGEYIATLPVGYADGYMRVLSGRSDILIGGRRCRSAGAVCMDHMMVSSENPVFAGDEAVLLGCQGNECISAEELAALAGTINYEILTSFGRRLVKQYITE